MHKKLTLTVDEQINDGVHHLVVAYQEMAADESRETEAHEWAEGMVSDVGDETR